MKPAFSPELVAHLRKFLKLYSVKELELDEGDSEECVEEALRLVREFYSRGGVTVQ